MNDELITKIISTTKNIKNCYNGLEALENTNKKDTDDYKKIIAGLKNYAKEESKLLSKYPLEDEKNRFALISRILENVKREDVSRLKIIPPIDYIINLDYEFDCFFRTVYKINHIATERELLMSSKNQVEYLAHKFASSFMNSVEDDFARTYLSIFQDVMNSNVTNNACKDFLFNKVKYELSLICPTIEEDMIESEFTIPHIIYHSNKMYPSLLLNESYSELLSKESYYKALKSMVNICGCNDIDLNSIIDYAQILLMYTKLKTSMLFMDNQGISQFKEVVNDNYNSNYDTKKNIAFSLINQATKDFPKSKEKIRVVSFFK